jgi:protein-S-isoprenylcysteine O-methyltransferase Ste14
VVLNILADTQLKRRKPTVKPFQPSTALITEEIFGVSRNPMYLGMVWILIGLGICLASLNHWYSFRFLPGGSRCISSFQRSRAS